MALFCSVSRLFERFAHFLLRSETRAQQSEPAAEKLPEQCEAFDYTANDKKCRKRRRKVPEKYPLGEREEEREVKVNKGSRHEDEAEITPEKIKKRGRAQQKKREMHSLEKLMEGGSELREAGEKKRKKRKRKQPKVTEPTPLLVEVKPLPSTIRCSFLKPIEGELPMLPSVSRHLPLPAAHLIPLPPVTKPERLQNPDPEPDERFSISSSQVRRPKRLPPSPTPAPDEAVALGRPPSRKPQPFPSSQFEPPPELMLIDIEDEESEYVEYTGKTFRASDLCKSERPQTPEAEIRQRRMLAWLEVDEDEDEGEVQEEAWSMEVVRAFEEEDYDPSEMGDSEAIEGPSDDDPQIAEFMRKLFCEASPDGPKNETQDNMNVQTKSTRKVPFSLFTWAEKKAQKKKEKKIIKEKEQRDRELLLDRYMNDPKLKHLWINKHNRNYNSS